MPAAPQRAGRRIQRGAPWLVVNHQGQEVPIIRIFLIIILLFQCTAYACDEDVECPKCGEKSEFTWNPSNQYATSRLSHFYEMEDLINSAYETRDFDRVKELVKENLDLAAIYRCNWNYGNAVHDSNRILGFIALENNDITQAATYLMEAGKSTGSPQLDSFGPNLDLANELLLHGQTEAVVDYLLGVRKFWDGKESMIDEWIQKIRSGEDVKLNQYQLGLFEMALYGLSLAWPLILVFAFWLKIKAHLSNNWSFPVAGVLSGFIAMFLGGELIGPVIMALIDVVSDEILGPVIIGISLVAQVGAPLLAIYLVVRFFKSRSVSNNG